MEKLHLREFDRVQFTKMVSRLRLFSSIKMGLLEEILAWVKLYRYRKGEEICRQGDAGDYFFVVYEGKVSVRRRKFWLFSTRVAALGPGDCFGETALVRNAPRNATVTCEEDTSVFVLLSEHFNKALEANPEFASQVRELIMERDFTERA